MEAPKGRQKCDAVISVAPSGLFHIQPFPGAALRLPPATISGPSRARVRPGFSPDVDKRRSLLLRNTRSQQPAPAGTLEFGAPAGRPPHFKGASPDPSGKRSAQVG